MHQCQETLYCHEFASTVFLPHFAEKQMKWRFAAYAGDALGCFWIEVSICIYRNEACAAGIALALLSVETAEEKAEIPALLRIIGLYIIQKPAESTA